MTGTLHQNCAAMGNIRQDWRFTLQTLDFQFPY